MFCMMCGLET